MTLRRAAVLAAPLLALAFALALALPDSGLAAEKSAPVTHPGPPTNVRLLQSAVRLACDRLVAKAPITPGTRIALRAEANQPVDADVAEALLQALNARHINCVMIEVPPDAAAAATPAPPAAPTGPGGGASTSTSATPPPAGGLSDFSKLQADRAAQAARADSIAKAGGPAPLMSTSGAAAASSSVLAGGGGDLPVVAYRVGEARVDYVRQFRGGAFGSLRVERRATTTIALRMSNPGSDAVAWSASADTSVGDVVLHSDLSALEDRQRPETRPVAPSSSMGKIVEPVLVVVLIAGLVSLFYQNRP